MEGPLLYCGRLVALRQDASGRSGRLSVRGAQVEVALDLVPEARPGDSVLVHAGVALSLLRDEAAAAGPPEAGGAGEEGEA